MRTEDCLLAKSGSLGRISQPGKRYLADARTSKHYVIFQPYRNLGQLRPLCVSFHLFDGPINIEVEGDTFQATAGFLDNAKDAGSSASPKTAFAKDREANNR